jgi:glutathione S-transferase
MALNLAGVKEDNDILKRYLAKVHQVFGFMDERLGSVPWLAGDEFSGVSPDGKCYLKNCTDDHSQLLISWSSSR